MTIMFITLLVTLAIFVVWDIIRLRAVHKAGRDHARRAMDIQTELTIRAAEREARRAKRLGSIQ